MDKGNMLESLNHKGQASFEMMFVLAVVVILSTVVLFTGINNFHNYGALAFTHNSFNQYKVKENYHGSLIKMSGELKDNNIIINLKLTKPININDFNYYKNQISMKIKDKTKYSTGIINTGVN